MNMTSTAITEGSTERCACIQADICRIFNDGCNDNICWLLSAVQPLTLALLFPHALWLSCLLLHLSHLIWNRLSAVFWCSVCSRGTVTHESIIKYFRNGLNMQIQPKARGVYPQTNYLWERTVMERRRQAVTSLRWPFEWECDRLIANLQPTQSVTPLINDKHKQYGKLQPNAIYCVSPPRPN